MSMITPEKKPDYLSEYTGEMDYGQDEVAKYAKPPFIKIISSMTADKQGFQIGDAVVVKHGKFEKISDLKTPFEFTPLLIFSSYIAWNPRNVEGLTAMREFSLEATSEVGKIATDQNFENREVPCPEASGKTISYCHNWNVLCIIHDKNLDDLPINMFFGRGEWKNGQNICASFRQPLPAGRYEAIVGDHKGKKGVWQGLDVQNAKVPYLDEENFKHFDGIARKLDEMHQERMIKPEYTEEVGEEEDQF